MSDRHGSALGQWTQFKLVPQPARARVECGPTRRVARVECGPTWGCLVRTVPCIVSGVDTANAHMGIFIQRVHTIKRDLKKGVNTCAWPQSRGVAMSRIREMTSRCASVMWTWLPRVSSDSARRSRPGPSHGAGFMHRFWVSSVSFSLSTGARTWSKAGILT